MSEIIPGHLIEPYAIVGDERRHIPNTTHDINIDVQTGAVEFTILLDTSTSGLIGAFLADETGEFTGREEYDRLELDIYRTTEDDEPTTRYYADFPDVEADICLPIDPDVALAEAFVFAEPKGRFGFKEPSPVEDDESDTPSERDNLRITSGNLAGM